MGTALMDQRGWANSDTKNVVETLIDAQSRLGYWGQVAARQSNRVDQARNEHEEELDDEGPSESTSDDWEN